MEAHFHAIPSSPTPTRVYSVGVYGATDSTGQVLLGILTKHPNVNLVFATSENTKETADGIKLVPSENAPLTSVDIVFLCLPHGAAAKIAAKAVAAGVRVIDLSADLRLDSKELYKQWYRHEHDAPHLLPVPYGLPEINRINLKNAKVIANPGCHVTAILLALYPLAKAKALTGDPIISDSKTSISAAGKFLKLDSSVGETDVRPYSLSRIHRHVPEIEQELYKLQPDAGPVIFMPHVIPIDVGLLVTIYVKIKPEWSLEEIQEKYKATYVNEPFVNFLTAPGEVAQIRHVAHKNNAVIAVGKNVGNTVIITSAIDNLRKGASSQAIQNFNLMFNLPETTGLL
jgi:N-acetyl-gamma-glutamyl-phosphate reductase